MMLFLQIHVSIFIVVKSCNVKIETRQQTAPWSDLNDVVFIPVCQNWIGNYQRSKNSLDPPTEQTLHTSSFSYNLCCRDLLPNKAERRFLTAVMLMLFQSLGKHTHILGLISGLHKFFVFVIMNNRSVPVEDHVSTLLYVLLLFCVIFSFQHPFPAPCYTIHTKPIWLWANVFVCVGSIDLTDLVHPEGNSPNSDLMKWWRLFPTTVLMCD